MMEPGGGARAPLPADEIERRLQWRAAPVLVFLAMLVGLAVLAAVSLFSRPLLPSGLPDDPDVLAARSLLEHRVAAAPADLRFENTLLGEPAHAPNTARQRALVDRAAGLLARARARHPRDARMIAACAHVALARRRFAEAERDYRAALDLAPHYGEARLGLGVLLAERAEREPHPLRARGLRLRATAQFAAVDPADSAYLAALYDRVVMLERVGRRQEAQQRAQAYLARDAASAWAQRLRQRAAPGAS